MKYKVLFVCIHNSARSQMAEAFLNLLGQPTFIAQSAGIEPGNLNPIVIDSMAEIGIDLSSKKTKSVAQFIDNKGEFDFVITVCDETSAERCPIFPGTTTRLHWGFPDPSALNGTYDERLLATSIIRDAIKAKIIDWVKNFDNSLNEM